MDSIIAGALGGRHRWEPFGAGSPIRQNERDLWVENAICMRNAGVPVEMVAEYVKLRQQGDETFSARRDLLKEVWGGLLAEIEKCKRELERLEYKIERYEAAMEMGKLVWDRSFSFEPETGALEVKAAGLPCTACRCCTSRCPKELPIPELIALYNERKATGGGFIAPMAVGGMPEEKRPASCIGCRSCEQVCPQQIKIYCASS